MNRYGIGTQMQLRPKELKLSFRVEVTFSVNERKDAEIFRAYLKQTAEHYGDNHEGLLIGKIQMDLISK